MPPEARVFLKTSACPSARIQPRGWIGFDRIRLQDFGKLKLSDWPQGSEPLKVSIFTTDLELANQTLSPRPGIQQATE